MWRRFCAFTVFVAVFVLLAAAMPAGGQGTSARPNPAVAANAIVQGVVVAAGSGAPLRGADVRIDGGPALGAQPRWTVTDDRGRYQFGNIPPGRYILTASKTGYVTLAYGQLRPAESGRPVEVSGSAPLEDVDFVLPRGAVIVARVTDRFGEPVRGVQVQAQQVGFIDGVRRLQPTAASIPNVTDDRGEIRLFGLAPGEYYVAARAATPAAGQGIALTYHPGTVAASEARPIQVGLGEEVAVTFPLVSLRPSRISGVVLGSNGAPLANARATLVGVDAGLFGMRPLPLAGDGSFSAEDLAPGEYVISVQTPEHVRHPLRLYGEDATGLVVRSRKPAMFRGRVIFDDGKVPALDELTPDRVTLRPAGSFTAGDVFGTSGSVPLDVGDDWRFTGTAAGSGPLQLRAPAGWFLKAVVVQGRDITDLPLDLAAALDGKDVDVILTRRHSAVTGVVTDDRGQALTDCVVVVFPQDDAHWTGGSRFIARGRPDQQGRFAIDGLPAGEYFVAALQYLAPGEERSRDALARLRPHAAAVTLAEGESRVVNTRLAP